MTFLLLGLIIWVVAHLFKRLAPSPRAALQDRLGDASKGVIAAVIVLSIVLMVIGYRAADFVPLYDPPGWTVHLNNLLMILAIALYGLGSSKSPLRSKLRHPMLAGTAVWAVAHLLVNGDLASLVLFGTIGAWAVGETFLINAKVPEYAPYEGGTSAGTVRLLVITLVLFAIFAGIHAWIGPSPFPG